MNSNKIVLASSSPRRIEMMQKSNLKPIIMPADIDETLPEGISMRDAVMFLALKKALWVESKLVGQESNNSAHGNESPKLSGNSMDNGNSKADESTYIIAADTVVFKDEILGKPVDRQDAFNMLKKIKNSSHQVATGVAILKAGEPVREVFVSVTDVYCKDYTDQEINEYLDTGEPFDKAGAYAIQGIFSKHIDHYVGDFNTVVGFPWDDVKAKLSKLGAI